jgi:hypothetical protein
MQSRIEDRMPDLSLAPCNLYQHPGDGGQHKTAARLATVRMATPDIPAHLTAQIPASVRPFFGQSEELTKIHNFDRMVKIHWN